MELEVEKTVNHLVFFLKIRRTIPNSPLFVLGSTDCLQLGQVTGADNTVAPSSISGATNVLPQCGQVTIIIPLSMFEIWLNVKQSV